MPDNILDRPAIEIVRKTADETVNNSATLQNDDALFALLRANERVYFTLWFLFDSTTVADLKIGFSVPSGATLAWNMQRRDAGGAYGEGVRVTASDDVQDVAGQGAGTIVGYTVEGTVLNGATQGNLQFRWAQNTAEVSNSRVFAQSYLLVHR